MRVEKWGEQYRLIQLKGLRMGARKRPRKTPYIHSLAEDEGEYWERRWNAENERFSSSVSRSRSRVKELAMCNKFEYFCTFTLSDEKQDRFDLKQWVKDFGNWIGNYNKRYNAKLEYLIIPEQHKNGAWHAHGLLKGISNASIITNKHGYLEIPYYSNRFGFMNMSPIRHQGRCATYVSKYITKDTVSTARVLGRWAHTFYSSRGLSGKQILWSGYGDFKADIENPFCKIAWVDFKHAMETIGFALLALKDPHHTMKYTISKILNLENSYDDDFISTETLRCSLRKTDGGKNNGQTNRVQRSGGMQCTSRDTCGMVRPAGGGCGLGLQVAPRKRRRSRRKFYRRTNKGRGDNEGVLFQPMDENRHVGNGVQEMAKTPREMIEAADRAYTERTFALQNKIAYATSQGQTTPYFDYAHKNNHMQLTFFGMGNE